MQGILYALTSLNEQNTRQAASVPLGREPFVIISEQWGSWGANLSKTTWVKSETVQEIVEGYFTEPHQLVYRQTRIAVFFLALYFLEQIAHLTSEFKPYYQRIRDILDKRFPQLVAIFQEALAKSVYFYILTAPVKEPEQQLITPPDVLIWQRGVNLWQAIAKLGTPSEEEGLVDIPGIKRHSIRFLRTFLMTDQSINAMAQAEQGAWTTAGIHKNLYTTLEQIWNAIPQEQRQGFQSGEEAIKTMTKSETKEEANRERMRQGWDRLRQPETGAIEFSDTHKDNLSQAASRRQQRIRAIKQAHPPQDQV